MAVTGSVASGAHARLRLARGPQLRLVRFSSSIKNLNFFKMMKTHGATIDMAVEGLGDRQSIFATQPLASDPSTSFSSSSIQCPSNYLNSIL